MNELHKDDLFPFNYFWLEALEAGKQVGKSFLDRTEEVLPFQKTKINFCKSYQNTQNAASIQTILLNFKLATSNFTTGTLARRDFVPRRDFELRDFKPRDFVPEGILSQGILYFLHIVFQRRLVNKKCNQQAQYFIQNNLDRT